MKERKIFPSKASSGLKGDREGISHRQHERGGLSQGKRGPSDLGTEKKKGVDTDKKK